jgi:HEAT repeat protein
VDLEAIRALNRSTATGSEAGKQAALERLGNPSPDELVEGMLRALRDPARRVRRLAARLSLLFASDAAVEARLLEIVEDEDEIGKIRGSAFQALSSGKFLSILGAAPDRARGFFGEVPELERYRQTALDVLVSLDPLPEGAQDLLRYVVETGTKEEAVAATRSLCGFKVVNLGAIEDPAERRHLARTCEPARGRVFFWVPRSDT